MFDRLRGCSEQAPAAKVFFEGMSNSLQRFHIDNINAAKTDETRTRRLDKGVTRCLAGKQR